MESQVSGKRELITKAYGVSCADDDSWKSLGNSQDVTGNGAEHEATKPIWIQTWCSLVYQCTQIPFPCSFFQEEMSLKLVGGWGCNLLLPIFSNGRFGKKQTLSRILNELLAVQMFKTEAIIRAANNIITRANSNKDKHKQFISPLYPRSQIFISNKKKNWGKISTSCYCSRLG